MMSRGIKRTITVVMVLISVFLLVSPVVFAKVHVRIDDEGLKSVHIRANIFKEGGPVSQGAKHGMVQAMVREITPKNYSYKFMLDLKKASADTQYYIWLWADLPEEVIFTVYGEQGSGIWDFIELYAISINLDSLPPDGVIETSVGNLLGALGLIEEIIELNTSKSFTTDDRGSFKSIKEGIINESNAMEYALDLVWPTLRKYIINKVPPLGPYLPPEVDFADLGIIGLTIHGGSYSVSGGARFVGPEDEETGEPVDVYYTEPVTIDREWNDFVWWAPGYEP